MEQLPATVFIVDDDRAVRDSLQWLIESAGLHARTFPTAGMFLEKYDPAVNGCLVADIRLPGMSGLELQETLNHRGIDLPTIIITGHGDVPVAVRAMKAGAIDFLEKPFSDQTLLDRIHEALTRDADQRHQAAEAAVAKARLARLSPRERQVIALVVAGKLNKQIATELGLSPKTIEVHRAHVMEKMEADSVASLVRLALLAGLGSTPPSRPVAGPLPGGDSAVSDLRDVP